MSEVIKEVDLKDIFPSKLNPRLEISIERLNELAESIREVGLLEPIIVRPVDGKFEVVVGERRYRASQQAGLVKVPAIVREYTDEEVVQLNLIENVQREDLSALEKGKVCKYLLENCPEKYPSLGAIAEKIGVSSNAVSTWMRAFEIVPEEVQTLVAPSTISGEVPEGKIDFATAVKVGRQVKGSEKQVEVIRRLAERRLPTKERAQVIEEVAREPEKPIEEIIEEVVEAPYELQFIVAEKEPILEGRKTQTSRTTIPDPKLKAGATVYASVREPHFADLRIVSIERKKLKYFNDEDAKREGYRSLREFKEKWQEIHEEWDEDQLVYAIHFEKLE
jgi:ParB family chromosome partitioning protein